MFAIIETGGKQYKVEKGLTLDVELLEKKEGESIDFDYVLLINDGKDTKVGTPNVNGASVSAKVIAHKRGDKIIVFKMKAKKRYQKKQGHRQELTTIEITDIKASGAKATPATPAAKAEKTEKAEKVEAKAEKPVVKTKRAPAKKKEEA